MVVIHAAGVTTPRVRHRSPFFAQFYFENHQSVLGSRGPASSSAHTKTAIMAIDAEHALHDGRADADGAPIFKGPVANLDIRDRALGGRYCGALILRHAGKCGPKIPARLQHEKGRRRSKQDRLEQGLLRLDAIAF